MKKTLAFVLVLAMVLSSVFTFTAGATLVNLKAEAITVDGVLDDSGWKADGWTNIDETTGWYQNGPVAETEFDYDYQIRTDDTTLYVAAKFNQAPVWNETKQDGATNLRFWVDGTPDDAARTGLFDFTYDKSEGATAIIKETKDSAAATPVAGVVCAATEGTDYLYIEFSIPLAGLGIAADSAKILFTGSQPGLLKTAATEEAEAVYGYCALHSLKDITATNNGDYWKDSTPWRDAIVLSSLALRATDSTSHDGSAYGQLTLTEAQTGVTAHPTLLENTAYTLTFNAKGTATLGTMFVNLYTYDSSDTLGAWGDIAAINDATSFTEWKTYEFKFTTPAGFKVCNLGITAWAEGGKNTGVLCVDDIVIAKDETGTVVFYENFEDGFHSCTWGEAIDEFTVVNPPKFAASTGALTLDTDPCINVALGADYKVTMVRDGKVWSPVAIKDATIPTAWNDKTPKTADATGWQDADGNLLTFTDAAHEGVNYLYTSDNSGAFTGKELTDGMYLDNPAGGSDFGNNFYNCGGHITVTLDLGAVNENLFAFYTNVVFNKSWGMVAGSAVEVLVSEDGTDFTKVAGTVHTGEAVALEAANGWEGHIFGITLDHKVAGRYVRFEVSQPNYVFLNEIEVYANEQPDKLYVNTVLDVNGNGTNYSTAGLFKAGELGGAQRIIYYKEAGTFQSTDWLASVVFAPTSNPGEYEIIAITLHGGQVDGAYPVIDVPAGGFVLTCNQGNNWQDLGADYRAYLAAVEAGENPAEQAEPWWWSTYKDSPNEGSTEGMANYADLGAGKYSVGQKAYLYNINLELLTCSRDFRSFITIGSDTIELANAYNKDALVLTDIDKDAYKVSETNIAKDCAYIHQTEVNSGYADTDNKELTDGIKDVGTCTDASWIGFSAAETIISVVDLGDTKSVAKFMAQYCHKGWGIGIPATVSFYGSTDGQTFQYIGDCQTDTDAIVRDGADEFKAYDLELLLDKTVDTRYVAIVARKGVADGFSFAFVSEFEAYGIEELPPVEESTPEESGTTPETGDFTPIVLAILAMLLASSAIVVIRKRRA